MPRIISPAEEIKKAEAELLANPKWRVPISTKLTGPVYIQLMEDCIENDHSNITKAVEKAVSGYYEQKNNPMGITFSETERLILKGLVAVWQLSPEEVIRRLIRDAGKPILEETIEEEERLRKVVDSVGK